VTLTNLSHDVADLIRRRRCRQCPEGRESNLVKRNPKEAAHAECVHRAQSILEQVFGVAEKSAVKDSVPADWA